MAKDVKGKVGQVLGSDAAQQVISTLLGAATRGMGGDRSNGFSGSGGRNKKKGLSGIRGLAAGAGAAALAPMAAKGVGRLVSGDGVSALRDGPQKLVQDAGSKLGDTVGDKVTGKIDEAGGPSGIAKDALKSALPFGGGGGSKGGVPGVGKGRRMPVQQSVDVAVPIETAYNQWTQFEEWPQFMHRVTRVTQEDECTVSFATKIWGKTKEFTAQIETQRPEQRIKWRVSQGMTHTGVVTFHELGPRLTRIELSLDVDPGSLIEKAARGMRHVKRAARGDLHRFKAFIETLEQETGAWRGVIEEGELVDEHDPGYDRKRDYGSVEDLLPESQDQVSDKDEGSARRQGGAHNGGDPERRRRGRSGPGRSRQGERQRQTRSQKGSDSRATSQRGGRTRTSSSAGGASRSSGRSRSSGSSRSGGTSRSSRQSRSSGSSSGSGGRRGRGSSRGRPTSESSSGRSSGGRGRGTGSNR